MKNETMSPKPLDRWHVSGVPGGLGVKAEDVSALEDERDRLVEALEEIRDAPDRPGYSVVAARALEGPGEEVTP